MNIIIPDENESYNNYIERILSCRDNVKIENEYMERHHIVPRGWNGTNDSENLIWLFPEEHYLAHKLLALENPEDYVAVTAWHIMSENHSGFCERDYIIMPEDYGQARRLFGKLHSEKMTGEGNPNYGKPFTQERKDKISKSYNRKTHPKCRSVKNLETGLVFDSIREAARYFNMCGGECSSISKSINGKRKYAGTHPITGEKLHWEYVE